MGSNLKRKIIIVDARNLLWRFASTHNELSVHIDGRDVNTGGMYGFVFALLRIRNRYRGKVIIAWEGENNFRYDLYPEYKQKRQDNRTVDQEELLEEVRANEGRLNELLSYAGVRQYYGIGCEADDVMGAVATAASRKKIESIIYTGDSDLRQLVNSRITVISPGGKSGDVRYDRKAVIDKHGVSPSGLPLLKALAGDSSDNIPGLLSVGDKTAAALVSKYKTLYKVLCAAEDDGTRWPVAERFRKIILDGQADVELFHQLTTIRCDVKLKPVPVCTDKKEVIRLLKTYQFRSLSSASELMEIMRLGS